MKTIDCRAKRCPHPVIETRKLLLAEPGVPHRVLVGDETARENVSRLATSLGYTIAVSETEGGYALDLAPGMTTAPAAESAAAAQGKTVVFVSSDTLGSGDDELGRILMKNFIFTLTEFDTAPDTILFVNGGVRLTTAGSEVIEALEKLAGKGADIASCGLCLDFFGLKEQLKVGRATNMFDTVDTLQKAGRIIRP
jgi:selenium metabolism protein YedF